MFIFIIGVELNGESLGIRKMRKNIEEGKKTKVNLLLGRRCLAFKMLLYASSTFAYKF
jgi:hypothetical protein